MMEKLRKVLEEKIETCKEQAKHDREESWNCQKLAKQYQKDGLVKTAKEENKRQNEWKQSSTKNLKQARKYERLLKLVK